MDTNRHELDSASLYTLVLRQDGPALTIQSVLTACWRRSKHPGEQRLKRTMEVAPETRQAWLYYYQEKIGTPELTDDALIELTERRDRAVGAGRLFV